MEEGHTASLARRGLPTRLAPQGRARARTMIHEGQRGERWGRTCVLAPGRRRGASSCSNLELQPGRSVSWRVLAAVGWPDERLCCDWASCRARAVLRESGGVEASCPLSLPARARSRRDSVFDQASAVSSASPRSPPRALPLALCSRDAAGRLMFGCRDPRSRTEAGQEGERATTDAGPAAPERASPTGER